MPIIAKEIERTYLVSVDPANGAVRSVQARVIEVGVDETGAQVFDPKPRHIDITDLPTLQALLGERLAGALADVQQLTALTSAQAEKLAAQKEALGAAAAALGKVASEDQRWDDTVRAAVAAAAESVAAARA